ncbi:MAG: ATP-binding protein [Bacteroidetes bacterium]|nr:ATP-binding protein [Bacteroidota bacterium]
MNEKINEISKYNLWDGNSFPLGMKRHAYFDKIKDFLGNKLIKVLTGQRRAGKSFLLKQIATYLIENKLNPKNILYINKEFLAFDFIKNYKDLQEIFQLYIKEIKPKGRVYILIDEVQNILEWEKFVNAYAQDFTENVELIITGSNSKLLSGELATLLSGRYIEFEIFPYSYNEYLDITKGKKNRDSYLNFLNTGALPELFNLNSEDSKKQYVASVKDTILLRDIAHRRTIRDIKLLDDIFIYLVNNASNLLSITNIVNYFSSKKRKTSYDTIANYIEYIEETFLIHKCERFNIKGKETIGGNAKFYVNDLAFKNYLFSGFSYGLGYLLENAVYIDLLQKGYTVYTGNINNNEVDFVAQKDDNTIYIQCCYLLENKQTVEREYKAFEKINDNFNKYVISLDEAKLPSNKGILHLQAWNLPQEY